MSKITFTLTGIDDEGKIVGSIDVSTDDALRLIMPSINNNDRPVDLTAERPQVLPPAHDEPEPKRRGRKPGPQKPQKAGPGGWTPKPCCGSKGARHKKGCPAASGPAPRKSASLPSTPLREEDEEVKPLTEDQFDELKHLQEIGDLSSRAFAQQNGLALSEVNKAITSRSYREYREW
ncbi:protein of unknown function [Bradyrhizobium sp. ORS 285]|uniref:hypothetical protein n=1 Tax=Bradyrhizobium sp. ORS 285 TaxID=115808 RepID=UPI00024095B1|nr:hypothetical protein [Bradyrhizobium sp. ORS 285]CCD89877.1 hypothetical protein BRAO285_850083 [Bradyrhizobium sp. ORS 285]SMX61498.1 protein of unknown function [Bradyrhizobium sp. ORS 285]